MAKIERFEDIRAWQMARELVASTYRAGSEGKLAADFSLRDQMRRASISVMSNIAEGFERSSDKDFRRFLYMAKGSAGELRSHLYVAFDLDYLSEKQFGDLRNQAEEVSKAISGFINYLDG